MVAFVGTVNLGYPALLIVGALIAGPAIAILWDGQSVRYL